MSKTKSITLSRLPNSAHVEHISSILLRISATDCAAIKLTAQRTKLNDLYLKEDKTFKLIASYELTPDIIQADKKRIEALTFFFNAIRANLKNTDVSKKQYAATLNYAISTYRSIPKISYVEKTAQIANLLADMKDIKYEMALSSLFLKEALIDVDSYNGEFKTAYYARFKETEERLAIENMKTIRPLVDAAYKEFCEAIDAGYYYNTSIVPDATTAEKFFTMIEQINISIDMMKQLLSHRGKTKPPTVDTENEFKDE